jgi:hypothetical protein
LDHWGEIRKAYLRLYIHRCPMTGKEPRGNDGVVYLTSVVTIVLKREASKVKDAVV